MIFRVDFVRHKMLYTWEDRSQCGWCVTDLVVDVLIPFSFLVAEIMEFLANPSTASLVLLQSHCKTVGRPRKQKIGTGHINTVLRSFV